MALRDRFRSRLEERWADRITEIASEEISNGATAADIRVRVSKRLEAETTSRPFLDFLKQLFEKLLPFLLELLGGLVGGALGDAETTFCGEEVDPESETWKQMAPQVQAQAFAAQLTPQAQSELQAVAQFLKADYWQLILCLAKAVGWMKLIVCVRTSPSDWLKCIMASVDPAVVIACLTGAAAPVEPTEETFA